MNSKCYPYRHKILILANRCRKRVIVVILIIAVFGLIYQNILQEFTGVQSSITEYTLHSPPPTILAYNCCRSYNRNTNGNIYNNHMRTNILFLKTHKCASSTIQNILMRFGLRNSLNFVLPKKNNYIKSFDKFSDNSILEPGTETKEGKYNILTHHTQYRSNLKPVLMYPDTVTVTILREPSRLFESIFHFYKLQKKIHGATFHDFLNSIARNNTRDEGILHEFLQQQKYRRIGHNQMCRDLGLEQEWFRNETQIGKFIAKIDQEFDFVMIAEFMEESLVLLANLMKWPLHYVSFLPINSRPSYSKYNLTCTDILKLEEFNHADAALYRYFLNKFKHCLAQYGADKMSRDVHELKLLNEKLRLNCVTKENKKGYAKTIGYELKNNSDWECVYSTKLELRFTKELKRVQIVRYRSNSTSQNV